MQNKNNTRGKARKSNKGSFATLARHLSAVMKHPLTPTLLIEDIGNRLAHYSSAIDFDTPEMIERSLKSYEKTSEGQREFRKGGAR